MQGIDIGEHDVMLVKGRKRDERICAERLAASGSVPKNEEEAICICGIGDCGGNGAETGLWEGADDMENK